MAKLIFFISSFFIGVFTITAQVPSVQYFGDFDLPKDIDVIKSSILDGNDIVIAGISYQPHVYKIDTLGNIIWTTSFHDGDVYKRFINVRHEGLMDKIILAEDGYIYARYQQNTKREIWKIDKNNGKIEWKTRYNVHKYSNEFLIDYDDQIFLTYASDHIANNRILINKDNGTILSNVHLVDTRNHVNEYTVAIDEEKNIYCSVGRSIFKLSANDLNAELWRVDYPYSEDDFVIDHIEPFNDKLIVFGNEDSGHFEDIFCVAKVNGNMIWQSVIPNSYPARLGGLVISGNYFYCSLKGENTAFKSTWKISKIDPFNGNLIWNTNYDLSPNSNRTNSSGAVAIVPITGQGVYVSGYDEADQVQGAGHWGIVKLNENDGSLIYDSETIKNLSSDKDVAIVGMTGFSINNQPYFVSNIEKDIPEYQFDTQYRSTLVKMDTSSQDTLLYRTIGGENQFSSRVIKIDPSGDNNTLILKQHGATLSIAKYDFNNSLLWETRLNKEKMLLGTDISSATNGDIAILAHSANLTPKCVSNNNYLEHSVDSIFVFELSPSGELVRETKFKNLSHDCYSKPLKIINTLRGPHIYYRDEFLVTRRIISDGVLSSSGSFGYGLNHEDSYVDLNFVIDFTDSTLLSVTYSQWEEYTANISEKYKYKNGTLKSSRIYSTSGIENICKINSTEILLTGSNEKDQVDNGFIMKYNLSSNEVIWSNNFFGGQIRKTFFDLDTLYFYMTGMQNDVGVVKKISLVDGSEQWSYSFIDENTVLYNPIDGVFDSFRNEIIITGNKSDSLMTTEVFISKINTNGELIEETLLVPGFSGINNGTDIAMLNNGSIWIGGNINNKDHGKAGFIYELYPPIYTCPPTYEHFESKLCQGDSLLISDSYIKKAGLYKDTLEINPGCFNFQTHKINFNSIDDGLNQNEDTLKASQIIAQYQWIDCDNDQPIIGETGQSFIVKVSGSYSVLITNENCSTTSECIKIDKPVEVVISGDKSIAPTQGVKIYPNPTFGNTSIDLGQPFKNIKVIVSTISGKLISQEKYELGQKIFWEIKGPNGLYFILIQSENIVLGQFKVLKK